MNKSTITKYNNKYNVDIFNVVKFVGKYKMSFDMHIYLDDNIIFTKNIVVKRNETIKQAIENYLNSVNFINQDPIDYLMSIYN